MSVAEYLTPKKNYLTHDVIAFTEQSSNYFESGQRSKMITSPSFSLPSSTLESTAPPSSSFSISSAEFIATSVSVSDILPDYPNIPTAPSSSPSTSSSSPSSPSSSAVITTASIATSAIDNSDINTNNESNTVPRAKDRAKAREREREKERDRAASLPDSTYVFDDDIEEVSYGGIRPDVWCDDEPATLADRDLCTMEVLSLLL